MKPHEIETRSFEIIDREAGPHPYSAVQWQIVRRMIHTTADFEYVSNTCFHPKAVRSGVAALRAGATIFTDTNMARSGIRQTGLDAFGAEAVCLMAEEAIGRKALANGTTRAEVAVDEVADRLDGAIYAVGNAPTALLRLIELMRSGQVAPALVIGLPVGFINAAESKAALLEADVPYITNVGRKGGSNVAAAVVNALVLLAGEAG